MLQKIKILNFQSHQNTELEFVPGVNAIIGRSNSGKTAIFRAIKLLATNRPLGNHYHSNFANDKELTKIELQLDDGNIVSTTRGANAEYTVDGESFKGFGASVPDLVQKALNLSELNLQDQLDQHFLICSSAGEVARMINRIIRVDEVDGWVSDLTTAINTEQSELRTLEADVAMLGNNLLGYDYLEGFEKCVAVAEAIESRLTDKVRQVQQLTQLLGQLEEVEQSSKQISKKLLWENSVLGLEELQKQIVVVSDKMFVLSDYIEINERCKAAEKFVKMMEPDLNNVVEISEKVKAIIGKEQILSSIISDLLFCREALKETKVGVDNAIKKMIDFLTSLGRCPICFTELSGVKIREMIQCE